MKKLYNKYKEMIDKAKSVRPGCRMESLAQSFEDVQRIISNDILYWLKCIEVAKLALSYIERVKGDRVFNCLTDKEFEDMIEKTVSDKIEKSESKNDG